MCLAKAYVTSGSDAAGSAPGLADAGTLLMENVTQVDVEGDHIRLRSLFGDTEVLLGRVARVDFAEGRLVLERS
jgi:predicted RNA-binding protein